MTDSFFDRPILSNVEGPSTEEVEYGRDLSLISTITRAPRLHAWAMVSLAESAVQD
jgi:hypothetical protein